LYFNWAVKRNSVEAFIYWAKCGIQTDINIVLPQANGEEIPMGNPFWKTHQGPCLHLMFWISEDMN
jgi:hypothetical protein